MRSSNQYLTLVVINKNMTYLNLDTVIEHKEIIKKVTPQVRNSLCCKVFNNKSYLKTNMKIHGTTKRINTNLKKIGSKEEKSVCDICCKTFNNINYLKNHIKTTHDTTFSECPTCQKVFPK